MITVSGNHRAINKAHLIRIHVGLRARAGLVDDEREVVDELAADDLDMRAVNFSMPSPQWIAEVTSSAASWIAFPIFSSSPYVIFT